MARRKNNDDKAPNVFLEEVGLRIAQTRTKLGYSQYQLAELSELSQQQISYAERGQKGLRCENILKIAKALNISTDYLLTGNIAEDDLGYILTEIKDDIEGLDVNQRATLCEVMRLFIKAIKKIDPVP